MPQPLTEPASLHREILLHLTPEQVEEWKQYPETKEVLRFLRAVRENYREQLERGETLNLLSVEHTALQTSKMLGQIYGLNLMLDLQSPEPVQVEEGVTGYESKTRPQRAGSEK